VTSTSTSSGPTASARSDRTSVPAPLLRDPAKRWWVLVTIALAQLMVVLSVTIANIALPDAQAALDMTASQRQWVITGYALAFGGLLLLGGRLGDLFGRRNTFVIGLVGFALASVVAGAAPTFVVLAVARVAQGIFGAILAPAALAVLTTTFTEPSERARAFGVFSAISGAGAGIGLLAGGALTSALSWRWCFFLQVPFAVLGIIGALTLLNNARPAQRPRIDYLGAVLAVAGLASIVLGMTQASTSGWASASTICLTVAGVLLLAVFTWVESRHAEPLLPLRVVRDRDRAASFLAVLVVALAAAGVFFFLTFYLQTVMGLSAMMTGLAFMPMVLTIMATSVVVNTRLLPRFGPRWLVPAGMLLAAAGLVLLAQLTPTSSYWASIVPALILVGLGYGTILASGMSRATLGVLPEHAGAAGGLVNTSQQIGLAIGTALLAAVAAGVTGTDPSAAAAVAGYSAAYLVGAGIFVAGAVVEVFLFRSQRAAAPAAAH